MVDDGEKFGVWPGTHAHVYEKGWLDRFFDRLLATEWLDLATLSDVVDRVEATAPVYLPTASYREMGEWALPLAAQRRLERAKHDLERLGGGDADADLLRGGFWRTFLVKYPEVADTYWKMLRLSGAVRGALARAPHDGRLTEAQVALWRGQANDAYWHGVFGGCYLPHLRRAVKSALLECERRLIESGALPTPAWTREDGNGDGREEVYVRTRELTLTLNPALGGAITELGYLGRDLDVGDVLARRPEIYHAEVRAGSRRDGGAGVKTIHDAPAPKEAGLEALLAYDEVRRGSLLDGWFDAGTTPLDPVSPWERALLALPGEPLGCTTRAVGGAIAVTFTRGAEAPVSVEKAVTIREATAEVRYRLTAPAPTPVARRWAVRWAQALRSEPPLPRLRPSLIIIAGMGGSASGADLLAASGLPRLDVPILVHRGYGLPLTAGKDALVVAVSYSGDTAEVLSAADTALGYGVPVVTLSGGGRLGELATSRRLPHVRLPGGLMPRMALGYLFFALARVLTDVDLRVATDAELSEVVTSLESLAHELGPARATAQNEAKRLALAIGDRP